jgi:hypothetical protein
VTKKKPVPASETPLGARLDRIGEIAHGLAHASLEDGDRYWLITALKRIAKGEDPMDALDVRGRKGVARTPAERAKADTNVKIVFEVDGLIDAKGIKVRRGKAYNDALDDACAKVAKKFGVPSNRVRDIWDRNPQWRGMDILDYLQALS